MSNNLINKKVMIKGGGDLASGVAYRLYQSGYQVAVSEICQPLAVRRTVSFAQAAYCGEYEIEGVKGVLVKNREEFKNVLNKGAVPVFLADLFNHFKEWFEPDIIVDGRMMKRDNDTVQDEAEIVIGLGPGFKVGKDADAVIETCRGHFLGRALYQGKALADTGQPGEVKGFTRERVVYAPANGKFTSGREIGEFIEAGEQFGQVDGTPVKAKISGVIRGQIHPGIEVKEGWKIGDVDPRNEADHCFTISDKALAVGGGVLEAVLHLSAVDISAEKGADM